MNFPPEEKPPKELRRTVHQLTGYFIRVVDGDSLVSWLDKDFEHWSKMTVRLARINCPETNEKIEKNPILIQIGQKAKERLAELFADSKWFFATSSKPYKNDPHNRYVLDIVLTGGRNLSNIMIEEHLAVTYDGKTKSTNTDFTPLLEYWKDKC